MMRGGMAGHGPETTLVARPGSTPQTLRRIAGFFRPYRARLLLITFLIGMTVVLGVINPILLKLIIDNLLAPEPSMALLWQYGALMIALPIISSAIGLWQTYLSNVVGQRVMDDLRLALYSHLQWMPLRFFTETRTGEIQSRIGNDVNGVQAVVTDTASSLLANVATVLTTVIAMFILDWRLTLLSIGMVPIFAYITYRVGGVRRKVSALTQQSLAEVSAITEETLSVSGVLLSKTFGQQRTSIARFAAESRRLGGLQIRRQMIGRGLFAVVGTFFAIAPALVYLLAGTFMINGDTSISVGTIVAFTTLQSRLFFPIGQLLGVQVEIASALALFDRIFEYLEMPITIADAPDAVTLEPSTARGSVRFRGVSFRYPVTAAVGDAPPPSSEPFGVSDLDFEARPGELVALVGPSGAGKTTTTYLIPRLYEVDAGSVEIDGIDIRNVTLESLGQLIGFVTQETYLFHASVIDNLRYARPEATIEQVQAAARAAAIHDRIVELPSGYDTVVGERGYKLSGGERQRLAIARVVLKDPRILLLDEATSSLDTVSERLIQRALAELMEGRTTIAIAHRLSTVLRADRILVYEGGRIVEQGQHADLLAADGLYARLYREQFATEHELTAVG